MIYRRLKILLLGFSFGVIVLVGRFFYWQVLRQDDLRAIGEFQYAGISQTQPKRGVIYTRDGFPVVQNATKYSLIIDPQLLKISRPALEKMLKPVLGQDFQIQPYSATSRWVNLFPKLSQESKAAIEKLKISGVFYEPAQTRFYAEASMSAHLLGFLGNDSQGQPKGYYGVEGYYDRELKGRSTTVAFQKDAVLRPINLSAEQDVLPQDGRSLITAIDRPVQYQLEKQLREGVAKYQAKSGFGVILDPADGSVLAMANWPNYEPEHYWDYSPELYRNPIVSSFFEPGSIFKVLVMASAVNAGLISSDSICTSCGAPRTIADYTIKTWNEKYYANSTMTEVLVHSDNVGMVYVAEKLGIARFLDYYRLMGFDRKTGIDLEGEAVSPIRPINDWGLIDLATASFGQGIAVSPIQIVSAVNAIASGGKYYQPHIVKEVVEKDKHITKDLPGPKTIFTKQTTETITQMMISAVDQGEAKWAKPKGYQVAGKTGTAQIPIAGHYDPEKTVASFIGFAPAENPRFTMLISLIEPKTSTWGSETAAPLWFLIAGDIFRIWQIPPSTKN